MNNKRNTPRNKYQLLTLLFLVVAIVYVWQTYRAFHIVTESRTGKIIFNSIVSAVALFVSWYYFQEAQKFSDRK